jgi:hypothetical protein
MVRLIVLLVSRILKTFKLVLEEQNLINLTFNVRKFWLMTLRRNEVLSNAFETVDTSILIRLCRRQT